MRRIELKTRDEIKWMREAGLVVADIHAALREAAVPGVSLRELDEVSAEAIRRNGARSNFLGYEGYPATVCISVNDVVVHGIPDDRRLEVGDLVTFDCGAYVEHGGRQWHGDAAFTMLVGDEQAGEDPRVTRRRQLDDVTRTAMWTAVASLSTGRRISCVGDAVERTVEEYAERFGWEAGIVEEYTGHGIGTAMHQAPDVLNYRVRGIQPRLKAGMVLAVEPILTAGAPDTDVDADGWTVRTVDGSSAAQWEHTVAVLDDGIAVLTAPDGGVSGLAPYGVEPVLLD